jgi:hypothetical protein
MIIKENFIRFIILILICTITFISIVQMYSNDLSEVQLYGSGSAQSVFISLIFVYLSFNIKELIFSPPIIKISLTFGVGTLILGLFHINNFTLLSFLNHLSSTFYCLASILAFYTLIRNYPKLFMFTVKAFVITLPILIYCFFDFYSAAQLFDNSIALNQAYFILVFLPFALTLKNKQLKFLGIILIGLTILLSLKRAGIVAFSFSILGYLFFQKSYFKQKIRKRFNKIFIIALTGLLIFSFIFVFEETNNVLLDRFSSVNDDGGSGRISIWKKVLSLQMNSDFIGFLFGHGKNAVKLSKVSFSAHNDFQEILYNYGIFIFLIYLLFHRSIYSYLKKIKKMDMSIFIPFLITYIVFMFLSATSHLIVYPTYFVYLTSFMGIIIGYTENLLRTQKFKQKFIIKK